MILSNPATERQKLLEASEQFTPDTWEETPASETFAAGISEVFDEEATFSTFLNREEWDDRKSTIDEMISSGEISNPESYWGFGGYDYNKVAESLNDENILTDKQLGERRSQILADRRKNRQRHFQQAGTLGKASFMAGKMTGFMLDPVNIAAMPLGFASTSLKGLSTLSKIGRVGAAEAAIGGISEALIQPFIFSHKKEIDSPWSIEDSIESIGMAALASGTLSSVVVAGGGVAGYLKAVSKNRNEFKKSAKFTNEGVSDLEIDEIADSADRVGRSVEAARNPIDVDAEKEKIIRLWKEDLSAESGRKVPEVEEKKLKNELVLNIKRLNELKEVSPEDVSAGKIEPKKGKGIPARKAKKQAVELKKKAEAEEIELLNKTIREQRVDIQGKIEAIKSQIKVQNSAKRAEGDLSRIDQGIYPDELQKAIDKLESKRVDMDSMTSDELVEFDKKNMKSFEETAKKQSQPARRFEDYVEPESPDPQITKGRARQILEKDGIKEPSVIAEYDPEIHGSQVIKRESGDEVLASDAIRKIDDDINILNEIYGCSTNA